MEIYPAVDIRDGKCVRLLRGEFGEEEVFSDDPVAAARRWFDEGAPLVHVVDLDGARDGNRPNAPLVARMVSEDISVQLGGGIRSYEGAKSLLDMGVRRVVLGTVALEDPALRGRLLAEFGDRIAVGLDCRGGRVATRGWREQTDRSAVDVAREVLSEGGTRVIVTDIDRDGTLEGPNLDLLREIVDTGIEVVASGGVGSLEDLARLAAMASRAPELVGVIVGRALYVEEFGLAEAIATVEEEFRCSRNG